MGVIAPFGDGRDWFFERRFGLFVHWGLYAVSGWHEQEQWRGSVHRDTYGLLYNQFNPVGFHPDAWLDLMQDAGMEYLCVTTKHHDGFCLWDTRETTFSVMGTPYGRDLISQIAEACHRRSVPLCFYYSIADWHHPNYPNQGRHHELARPLPGDHPDWDAYMAFLVAQVRELCTNYGTLHGFWWDMNVPGHHDPSINTMIRHLQPSAVINNRGFDPGDFSTPERHVPDGRQFASPTEACQSVGRESWGFRREEDYYTTAHLTQSVARVVAMGGNYLLNVGPDADGQIPALAARRVTEVGDWFRRVRAGLVADPAPDLVSDPSLHATISRRTPADASAHPDTVYVVIPATLESSAVGLHPLAVLPTSATLLNTGGEVDTVVDVTPRRWYDQWHEGIREADGQVPQPSLRLRNLPSDPRPIEPMVVKLTFAAGARP